MLDKMRTHSQNWLIYLMFGAIILVFGVNFGPGFDQLNQTGCGRGGMTAATVNGTNIPLRLFEMQWNNFVFSARIPSYRQPEFRKKLIKQIVDIYLLAQEAERYGIKISDDEVDQQLLDQPQFQKDGVFNKAYFRNRISYYRLTTNEYREFERVRLQAQRMQELIAAGVTVSPKEAKAEYVRKNTKVKIEYVAIDASKMKGKLTVSAADANAFIAKNQKRLKEYYDKNLNKFTTPAKVRTRHIILSFKVRGKPTTEELFKLKDKMEEIRKETAKKGADFAALAKKYSTEPGAKSSGGLLPEIQENARGWDPAYVKAAFKLKKKGEISPIIKSAFGYHIIRLESRKEANKRPLSKLSVKQEIARVLLQKDRSADLVKTQAKKLIEQMKKGKDLKAALEALKQESKQAAPAKPAPTRPAPAKPAPTKAAPKKAEPKKAAPAKPAPTKTAPQKAAPKKAAPPVRTKPALMEAFAPAARRPAPAAKKDAKKPAPRAAKPAPRATKPAPRAAARAAKKPAPRVAKKPAAPKKSPAQKLLGQLKVKTSPSFSIESESVAGVQGSGAPVYPLVKAAFGLTKKQPAYDKPIEILGKLYIIRLKKRTPANLKKFEKEKRGYIEQMQNIRRKEFQEAMIADLRAKYKSSIQTYIQKIDAQKRKAAGRR